MIKPDKKMPSTSKGVGLHIYMIMHSGLIISVSCIEIFQIEYETEAALVTVISGQILLIVGNKFTALLPVTLPNVSN